MFFTLPHRARTEHHFGMNTNAAQGGPNRTVEYSVG